MTQESRLNNSQSPINMAQESRLKQFQHLLKNVDSFSDRQVEVLVDEIDFDKELENFSIDIKPNSGPYRGGQFKFNITCNPAL